VHDSKRTKSVVSEKAVLVRVILPHQTIVEENPCEELSGLAETAGVRVVGQLCQRRDAPDASTYLGRGKVEELRQLVNRLDADVVLFDNDLSPSQTRNLERAVGVKVLDRTELILDIFASRARTYEAQLAVELAQLEYSLPRLKRLWTHLSRQTMGVGMRGPGEKQLEVDRRLVEKRIHELRQELKVIERRRERTVAARKGFRMVSLVGYTNAGKSTLMNALTRAGVEAADRLFATLDTRTRRWQLPSWGPVLLSDTVGFIRDLPHTLITSFKATLEEARCADLLLHVADASNPAVCEQISSVYRVLEEIGAHEKDILLVLNKIDRPQAEENIQMLLHRYPHAVPISAHTGAGLDRLAQAVSETLSRTFCNVDIDMGVDNGRVMAYLAVHGEVLSRRYHDGQRVIFHCRLPVEFLGTLQREPGVTVRVRSDKHHAAEEVA
jgi:GTP-binding protein HflX